MPIQLDADTFIRANQSGLGTASDGNVWASTTNCSIVSNQAVFSTASPTAFATPRIGNTATDCELLCRVSIGASGNIFFLAAREQSGSVNNCYAAGINATTAAIVKKVASVQSTVVSQAASITVGSFYWLRFRLSSNALYLRYWLDGSGEPSTWNLSSTDSSFLTAGNYGFFVTMGTTTAVTLDNFSVNQVATLTFGVRPQFLTQISGAVRSYARSKFVTRVSLVGRTREKFATAMSGTRSRAAGKFFTRSTFLSSAVASRSATSNRITELVHALFRTGKHRAIKALLRSEVQHLNASFSEVAMSNPNTTIDVSTTITDMNNAVVSNLSSASAVVTFPDGSTSTYTANNQGNGVYVVTYTTKSPGLHRELWSFTDQSGATAQYLNINAVSF